MATPPTTRELPTPPEPRPPWWAPLSKFVQESGDAMRRSLTMSENMASEWVTLEFTSAVTTQERRLSALRGREVKGVLYVGHRVAAGAAPTVALAYSWTGVGPDLRVTLGTPLAVGDRLQVTFLVLPE